MAGREANLSGTRATGVLEAVLIASLFAAAIAFGGTQPLVWAAVKLALFLAAAAAIWIVPFRVAALPWKWLVALSALLGLQWLVLQFRGERASDPIADFVVYPVAFALSAALASAPAARARLVAALITLGAGEALYGLAQELAGWQQILGIEKIYYRSQATGTFVNPNHFSGLLEMTLPLAFAAAAWHADGAARAETRDERQERRAAAAFCAALALMIAAGVFASYSRMGIVSAVAGTALCAGVWTWFAEERRRGMRAAGVAGGLIAAALFGLWIGADPAVERFRQAASEFATRVTLWRESAALVRARPLVGAGWGAFPHLYPQVQATELEFAVEHAHNDYLELATEFGIPGAALLVALAAAVVVRALGFARRSLKSRSSYQALGAACGIAALGVHSLADFNLRLPANALIFSVLLGLAWAAATRRGPAASVASTSALGSFGREADWDT